MTLPSFSRLSTGFKMLLILTVALLPLGLIAIFASIESAQTARLRRADDARVTATEAARQLSIAIGHTSLDLRAVTARLDYAPMTRAARLAECRTSLADLRAAGKNHYEFAVLTIAGRLVCATPGFSGLPPTMPQELFATEVRLLPAIQRVQFEARSPGGGLFGVAEAPLETLETVTALPGRTIQHGIVLRHETAAITVRRLPAKTAIGPRLLVTSPVANGQVTLELVTNAVPIGVIELLLALLPILMWLAAAIIGWVVVDRLMIRPLLRLQSVVADYRPENGPMAVPHLTTPAREIRELGEAFRLVTERVALHESELAEGLLRQTKLTREVHHRVKNNLQVVASLISIHARGVDDPDVAAAYASIQRRVDALAVVHRNHFAEMEANRGVGLRALIGELAANLRATAAPNATHFAIRLDLITAFCTQDVAVPVAFLITEIVEVAMIADPRGTALIRLVPAAAPERATLSVAAAGLSTISEESNAPPERFLRVMEGLSRQLRTRLSVDTETGTYAIDISILPEPATDIV
ncbi:sensor histidine kinase [Sphingomonas prati]|uniref:histidine kinase n=1 Tax=Sphingomonas prati TaxID=1843237 RepID=A0A7W9BP79_9SPHN|nr:sensor histidine kinase [Sphingomonas prati]MBB5727597.1 two-component sensor histidine kinase [Sphingomonas prati]GGE79271.1 histidine kinase [Sphingomonas prati]